MTRLHTGMAMGFEAHVAADDERALVRLIGELDVAVAPRAEEAIVRAERFRPAQLQLDLSELAFMDSTGLRLMLTARERALQAPRQLVLRRGPRAVQRVFELTALERFFEFVD
jgi:anti-anti-sigma factor